VEPASRGPVIGNGPAWLLREHDPGYSEVDAYSRGLTATSIAEWREVHDSWW
jgi:hypothetical protein